MALLAGRPVAEEAHRVDGFVGRAAGDEHTQAGQRTGPGRVQDVGDSGHDLRHLRHPAEPAFALRQRAVIGADEAHAVGFQPRAVACRSGVKPHPRVHRGRGEHRLVGGEQRRCRQIVGDAVRHLGHNIAGRRGHHHDIGLLPEPDMSDVALGGQRERVGVDRPAGERLHRERGHEFGAGTGEDAAHLGAALPEPPDEVEAFVGGDAACDHQQYPLAAERCAGFGSALVSRVLHADTLRGRRNRRKRVAGAGQGQCTSGGSDIRIASGLPPVSSPKRVPRS